VPLRWEVTSGPDIVYGTQQHYSMEPDVSIDESLLLWKGRLLFKQYLPLKRSRFGIKLYKLCESSTGYVHRFYVYVGKDCSFVLPASGHLVPPAEFGATENIVWFLILPLLDKGYRFYVDNFYTSLPLFRMLYQHDTVACGTIRSNRKGYPVKSLAQRKHTLGQSSALWSGEFLAVRFTDKKDVNMLTTMHSATCTTVLLCAVEQ